MGHHLRRFISWALLLALPLSTVAAPAFAEENVPTEYAAATDACTQLSYEPILTDIIDFADWDDS